MDELSFKEYYIFTRFKDKAVCKTAGLTAMIRYCGLLTSDLNIAHIYREIINYQISKYGRQLDIQRDSFIPYKKPSKVKIL